MAHLLVIDDESNIRMMLRLALSHIGHTVETTPDGIEGLEKFGPTGAGWDLVLLDQRMPGMDGMEVLTEIRRRDPDACVLMVTAFGTVDLAAEAMRAGAADFLRKPFTIEMLRDAVHMALESNHKGASAPTRRANGFDALLPIDFEQANINGFHITSPPGVALDRKTGDITDTFTVRSAGGREHPCRVALPAYVVELVRAHADRDDLPGGDRFWQGLCGEALANHLWQNADFPENGEVRIEDLTRSLRHWVDAVLTAADEAGIAA